MPYHGSAGLLGQQCLVEHSLHKNLHIPNNLNTLCLNKKVGWVVLDKENIFMICLAHCLDCFSKWNKEDQNITKVVQIAKFCQFRKYFPLFHGSENALFSGLMEKYLTISFLNLQYHFKIFSHKKDCVTEARRKFLFVSLIMGGLGSPFRM